MNKSLYLSLLALEMLICSQENINVYLPFENILSTAKDKDMLYGIQELVKSGVLAPDTVGKGFDILPEAQQYLRPILASRAIIKIINKETQLSKICYLADNEVTVIEDAINRADKLRLTISDRNNFPEFVAEGFNMFLSEEISDNAEIIDLNEIDTEIEKIGLDGSIDELSEKDEVVAVVDILKPDSMIFSRIIIYRTDAEDRFVVFSSKAVSECFKSDFNIFKNRFDLILEETLC